MKTQIAVIDIDGVLADYRVGLLFWIRQSWPRLSQKANYHLGRSDTWINHESMGVPYRQWLDVLEMFRMAGGKQAIPVVEGAVELLRSLKTGGVEVVLLTSRPIDLYSNIYRDTMEWLRNNELCYDLVLWSKSKAEMVHKMRLTDKVIFAIDDEIKHVVEYDLLGIKTYWIDLYNKQAELETFNTLTRAKRVLSLKEIEVYSPNEKQP